LVFVWPGKSGDRLTSQLFQADAFHKETDEYSRTSGERATVAYFRKPERVNIRRSGAPSPESLVDGHSESDSGKEQANVV
jgi:hypothetical protein